MRWKRESNSGDAFVFHLCRNLAWPALFSLGSVSHSVVNAADRRRWDMLVANKSESAVSKLPQTSHLNSVRFWVKLKPIFYALERLHSFDMQSCT